MDYISGLPKVGDLGSIIVVVDRLSKYATFIAAPKTLRQKGQLISSSSTLSNIGACPRISLVIGILVSPASSGPSYSKSSDPNMSSSYHPQSDGQTERFNSMLEEYLQHFQPLLPHTLDFPQSVRSPLARSFSHEWKQNVDIARSFLEKAQKRMKKYADQNRRFIEFNAGGLVMVKVPDPRLSKSSRGEILD
ncbi:UNVERIFIED_CONTAM: hypothetical protein Slati_2110000 [Sesamum latifolium]|uniref:Uncharacterized protein n=1 Tax=Sesamum latifolium TaxID=2727402 RepID=A0AAW2WQU2_9LAMI